MTVTVPEPAQSGPKARSERATSIRSLFDTPLETTVAKWWSGIDAASKKAFFAVLVVNVLAFGFEMTNLTLHHDDVLHIFIQDAILGHYLGRFGFGWLHNYTQNHYVMPFLQMVEGILIMSAYGVLVSRFWGVRKAWDLAVMSAVMCVFPYMAYIYQYNTSMFPFPAAHLLVALAVVLSTRATLIYVAAASMLYVAAFSIYQAVAANAATIFVVWLLSKHLFGGEGEDLVSRKTVKATVAALVSVIAGGLIYLAAALLMHLQPDTIHSSDDAFHLRDALNLRLAVPAILTGTRAFLFWPENYFPEYLKSIQLAFFASAAIFCVWLPMRLWAKMAALGLLVLAAFAPRTLQLMHPEGQYHSLTMTSYAVLVAGAVMIINRAGRIVARNASIVLASFLIAGYVMQCNWVSTVNYLNTLAHFTTLTQVLARVRSIPDAHWDGKTIVVVGRYDPPSDYPFKSATGVATNFMDAKHMQSLGRLMRDQATFVDADETMPKVLEYAATHPPWPDPTSVAVLDGMGVVVFSKNQAAPQQERLQGTR